MKTARERALAIAKAVMTPVGISNDSFPEFNAKVTATIEAALLEQDRLTREACAKAITDIDNDLIFASGESIKMVQIVVAINAVDKVRAV